MPPFSDLPLSATSLFTAYASFAATVMLFRSMINDVIPATLRAQIISFLTNLLKLKPKRITIIIDEYHQHGNHVYESAQIYLGTIISPTTEKFKVTKSHKEKALKITVEKDQPITDTFRGAIQMTWRFVVVREQDGDFNEKRFFELDFNAEHKSAVLNDYLPFVIEKAKEIRSHRGVKLFTTNCPIRDNDYGDGGGYGVWGAVSLEHPATFDTLAMEPEMKKGIMEDLDRFLRRRDYYKRVGKVWRRGYLLYGPPGTGKSSLIAAMANYLKFDVYDFELSKLESDSELKRTLLTTTNRSILVIEDIDCNLVSHDRRGASAPSKSKLTLSGLLNFIDGLWSSCGDERIIVFTTNHKKKLDPALLRPGRMDMHIHMSYLTPNGFATLASNYLGIDRDYDQRQFNEIVTLLESCTATAAEVAEELMRSENASVALAGVVNLLTQKVGDGTPSPSSSVSIGPENEVDESTLTEEDLEEPESTVSTSRAGTRIFVQRGRWRRGWRRGSCN